MIPVPALSAVTRGLASLLGLALFLLSFPALADEPADPGPASADRPTASASRVTTAPVLDGDVANDPAWKSVTPATGFVQTQPDAGEPASEKTEVFLAFDDRHLYIGVICHDRQPEGIIVADSRRDASLDNTDSIRILLDTFDDDQAAFVFGTNPAGIQYDGQVSRDGTGENTGSGSFDLNWDGAWKVASRVHDGGWSAELAIPFRTLRFPEASPQTWGLNLQRTLRRHNEIALWSPVPITVDWLRVSLAGNLDGVEVPRQRLVQFTPYVLARDSDGFADEDADDFDAGFDLKVGLGPSFTLDATYNTDFAQVEADVQQINFDRFNLFFPEKRSFFLENSGLFRVGVPAEIELFFSRRIGIGPNGQEIPIDGGLRLTGKSGRTNVGVLYMATDEEPGGAFEDEFAVLRLAQDFGERSSVGLLITSREGSDPSVDDDYGRTFAVDGRWGYSQKGRVEAFAAKTDTPDAVGDEYAFRLGTTWLGELWAASVNYTEVGEGFDPQVGFLARKDFRKADAFVLRRIRPEGWGKIHELQPHIFYRGYWDFDGNHETGYLHVDNHWVWENGAEVHTGVNFHHELVKVPFEIFPGVIVEAGSYDFEAAQFGAFTDRSAPLGVGVGGIVGGFFGGDRVQISPSFRFRRGEKLQGELAWAHNEIDLPGGDFETDLGRLRLSYAFTPRIVLDGLVQYNDSTDQWSSNIRFSWRDDANSGLYIVYNDIRDIGDTDFESQRRWIVKYSYRFDFFAGR